MNVSTTAHATIPVPGLTAGALQRSMTGLNAVTTGGVFVSRRRWPQGRSVSPQSGVISSSRSLRCRGALHPSSSWSSSDAPPLRLSTRHCAPSPALTAGARSQQANVVIESAIGLAAGGPPPASSSGRDGSRTSDRAARRGSGNAANEGGEPELSS